MSSLSVVSSGACREAEITAMIRPAIIHGAAFIAAVVVSSCLIAWPITTTAALVGWLVQWKVILFLERHLKVFQ